LRFNLTVADYHTYFAAANDEADAVWVHNSCYRSVPDGYNPIAQKTEYGQDQWKNANGDVVYRGHDGKFYDLAHAPTARTVDGVPNRTKFTPATKSGLNLSDNIQISGDRVKNIELELRGQRIGKDGGIEAHKFSQHNFVGRFDTNSGELFIDWYETTNTGNNIGREIISSVIEKLGPDNVKSVAAKLGNSNRTAYDGFINANSNLDAVRLTPLGKALNDLGFKRFNADNAPLRIEAFLE
jgi:hypothetical protein